MASSRRKDAVSFDVFDDTTHPSEDWQLARTLQNYNAAEQPPMTDITSSNIVLNPPTSQTSLSPLKQTSPHSSPPIQINSTFFDSVVLPPPDECFGTDSPPKGSAYGPYFTQIAPRPQKVLFATFPAANPSMGKENRDASAMPSDSAVSGPQYLTHLTPVLGKRVLPDSLAARNRPIKKPKIEEEFDGPIPEPEDMPLVSDEGGKPPYSYSMMIGMAILRSPGRQMTLANIYKWILDTFEFYREAGPGWQNSIRHNLSLSKLFFKKERPKDDPGKGHYWAIQEGSEAQFVNNKTQRRPTITEHTYFTSYEPLTGDTSGLGLPMPTAPFVIPPKSRRAAVDSSQFPCDSEFSSDATVPASDLANDDKDEDQVSALPSLTRRNMSPPPSPQMQSSPPIAHTPSRKQHFVSHSRSGSRAKLRDTFKDSGFYSSIESSIPRGNANGGSLQLTSDLDHDHLPLPQSSKMRACGRAEEEIARMRSSSFDPSPTKSTKHAAPAIFKKPSRTAASNLDSSSPLRPHSDQHVGFPPLTPGITLLPPSIKPPPTISPGTHLRRHRESVRDLVGTPARGLLMAGSGVNSGGSGRQSRKWSPFAFNDGIELELSPLKGVENEFAILDDDSDIEVDHTGPHSIDQTRPLPSLEDYSSLAFEDAITLPSSTRARSSTSTSPENWSAFFSSGSPVAPKSKSKSRVRPGLQRAQTSTGALANMSSSLSRGTNARLASPFRMPPPSSSSNSRQKQNDISPVKKQQGLKADAFWGADRGFGSSGDENEGAFRQNDGGLDLTKGFRSIGAAGLGAVLGTGKENEPAMATMGHRRAEKNNNAGGPGQKKSRPPLGRSSTNVL